MNKKQIIFLIFFSIFVIIIGYLLYKVFFAKPTSRQPSREDITSTEQGAFPNAGEQIIRETETEKPTTLPTTREIERISTGTQPPTTKKRVSKLVNNNIKSPHVDQLGQIKYYNQQDGKFYRVDKNGNIQLLSDETFYSVKKVSWSPTKDEAILEYPDGANIYYNFETKKQVSLPKHWEEFSFSSLGNKVAAKSIGLSPENRWLITTDPQGTNISLIEPMGNNADKVNVDWSPNKQIIAMSRTGKPLGADRQEVLFVGLHGENMPSTIIEGRDFKSKWSPTGKKLLYSVYNERNDYKPELWIVNAEGDTIGTGRKILKVNTWADKCTFADERFVYCAVPITLQRGAGFAPKVADQTPDTIYRIDTQTNLRTPISTGETYTIDSMFLSEDSHSIYFTQKTKNGLFKIDI